MYVSVELSSMQLSWVKYTHTLILSSYVHAYRRHMGSFCQCFVSYIFMHMRIHIHRYTRIWKPSRYRQRDSARGISKKKKKKTLHITVGQVSSWRNDNEKRCDAIHSVVRLQKIKYSSLTYFYLFSTSTHRN